MSRECYKDDRYFEEYIIFQNKRIERFTETLRSLQGKDAARVAQCERYLANFYRDLIAAKYSVGASKQEVGRCVRMYLEALKNCAIADYAELADVLSFAVLFELSVSDVCFVMEYTAYDSDALVCALKNHVESSVALAETDALLFPKDYGVFYHYIQGSVNLDSFLAYMEEEWYASCGDFAWFDSHKSVENIYVGYWSWLAGAVLKMNSVQVTDKRYIPCALL